MNRYRSLAEYHRAIRHLIAEHDLPSEVYKVKIVIDARLRDRGDIFADAIVFQNGATLRFQETVELDGGYIRRVAYSYGYKLGATAFRYERDPERAEPYTHSLCHLHVNESEIRYPTHETSFEEVFKFILANFYGVKFP